MSNYVNGKTLVITGAAGGFGRLLSEKAAGLGARIVCVDVNEDVLGEVVEGISTSGGNAEAVVADVTDLAAMHGVAKTAVERFGAIDVMVNNAGVMPLGFISDHEAGAEKWHQCIDINIKGVLNGMIAVHDQMMTQGHGHIVNLSSIYGNYPVTGAAVYGASKAAVNFLSESFRVEARGKIKITIVKPTGVPGTGLSEGVVNPGAVVGIVGQNIGEFGETMMQMAAGETQTEQFDPESVAYAVLDPAYIADQILHAINQPRGVSIGDITIRASGDHYIL